MFELLRDAGRYGRKLGVPLAENHLLGMAAVVEHLRGNPQRAGRLLAASRHLAGRRIVRSPFALLRIGRSIATTSRWCVRHSVPRRRVARATKSRR